MKIRTALIVINLIIQLTSALSQIKATINKISENEIEETCDQIHLYRELVGVQDGDASYPNFTGWTNTIFSYDLYEPIYKGESIQQFQCNCDHKIYNNIQDCLNACKVNLGCFTGICPPINGQVCLYTVSFVVAFSVDTKSYRLDWKPNVNLSDRCQREKEAWENRIEIHEGKHVQDALAIAKWAELKWMHPKTYKACAATEEEAKRIIKTSINDELFFELKLMEIENLKRSEAFHKTAEGIIILDINCEMCR